MTQTGLNKQITIGQVTIDVDHSPNDLIQPERTALHQSKINGVHRSSAIMEEVELTTNIGDMHEKIQIKRYSWFTGVFVPMILNLICVAFFSDMHQFVKYVGWGIGSIIFFFTLLVSFSTLTNLCVIATNGNVRDGGLYFFLSRTLGPNIGGVTGFILVYAHTTGIAYRMNNLSYVLTEFLGEKFIKNTYWDRVFWQGICNTIVFIISLFGIRITLLCLLVASIVLIPGVICVFGGVFGKNKVDAFVGVNIDSLRDNIFIPNLKISQILAHLSIFFPVSSGVVACSNYSGYVKQGRRAIPIGGFSALMVASSILFAILLLESSCYDRNKEITNFTAIYQSLVPGISFFSYSFALLGSSISFFDGSSRIISLMCEDGLLPSIICKHQLFDEPLFPKVIQFIFSLLFVFVESSTLNSEITNCTFQIPFALINYCVYAAASAHYPGFRPSFKLYSKSLAIIVSFICFVTMFLINWIVALVNIVVCVIVYSVYHYLKINDNWGTVSQSLIFYRTLKEELNLYHVQHHPKIFRPNIILISRKHPDEKIQAIDFLSVILHNHGMTAFGRVIVKEHLDNSDFIKLSKERDTIYLKNDEGYRTFYDCILSESFIEGACDLLLMVGIGMMRPNTVCFNFPHGWLDGNSIDCNHEDIITIFQMAEQVKFHGILTRNVKLFTEKVRGKTIDVWWDKTKLSGMTLLMGHLLSISPMFNVKYIRILTLTTLQDGKTLEEEQKEIAELLYRFRVKSEVIAIHFKPFLNNISEITKIRFLDMLTKIDEKFDEYTQYTLETLALFDLINRYSQEAAAIIVTIPERAEGESVNNYMARIDILSDYDKPFIYVNDVGETAISFTV